MYANGMSQAIQSKPFLFRDDSTLAFWYEEMLSIKILLIHVISFQQQIQYSVRLI